MKTVLKAMLEIPYIGDPREAYAQTNVSFRLDPVEAAALNRLRLGLSVVLKKEIDSASALKYLLAEAAADMVAPKADEPADEPASITEEEASAPAVLDAAELPSAFTGD